MVCRTSGINHTFTKGSRGINSSILIYTQQQQQQQRLRMFNFHWFSWRGENLWRSRCNVLHQWPANKRSLSLGWQIFVHGTYGMAHIIPHLCMRKDGLSKKVQFAAALDQYLFFKYKAQSQHVLFFSASQNIKYIVSYISSYPFIWNLHNSYRKKKTSHQWAASPTPFDLLWILQGAAAATAPNASTQTRDTCKPRLHSRADQTLPITPFHATKKKTSFGFWSCRRRDRVTCGSLVVGAMVA